VFAQTMNTLSSVTIALVVLFAQGAARAADDEAARELGLLRRQLGADCIYRYTRWSAAIVGHPKANHVVITVALNFRGADGKAGIVTTEVITDKDFNIADAVKSSREVTREEQGQLLEAFYLEEIFSLSETAANRDDGGMIASPSGPFLKFERLLKDRFERLDDRYSKVVRQEVQRPAVRVSQLIERLFLPKAK
jgi:hypothetical protein